MAHPSLPQRYPLPDLPLGEDPVCSGPLAPSFSASLSFLWVWGPSDKKGALPLKQGMLLGSTWPLCLPLTSDLTIFSFRFLPLLRAFPAPSLSPYL